MSRLRIRLEHVLWDTMSKRDLEDLRECQDTYNLCPMSTVVEIEKAVEGLPDADFETFAAWFDQNRAQRVDAAFEKAILAGDFDALAAQALEDHQANRTVPLDEFIRRA